MELDASAWSGEGTFTQQLLDALQSDARIRFVKVEDAPASRSDASFSFISNEIYVAFVPQRREPMTIAALSAMFEAMPGIGPPDYEDDGMLQYLKAERIIPPYQTRGYKLIELVRIYLAAQAP